MNPRDPEVTAMMLTATPRPLGDSDWDDVVRRAQRRRTPRWLVTRAIPAAAVVMCGALLAVLFTRLEGPRSTIPARETDVPVSLLERPQAPADRTSGVEQFVDDIGVDPASIRRAQTVGTTTYYVGAVNSGRICLITSSPGFGDCAGRVGMYADGAIAFPTPSGLAGIVIDRATAARSGGIRVAVVNNTFVLPPTTDLSTVEVQIDGTWRRLTQDAVTFQIFERPQTAQERSAATQAWVAAMMLDPASIRLAIRFDDADWALGRRPASNTVCLTKAPPDPGDLGHLTCATVDEIAQRGGMRIESTLRTRSAPAQLLLVPDGVTRLRIGGRDVRAPGQVLVEGGMESTQGIAGLWAVGWRPLDPDGPRTLLADSFSRGRQPADDDVPVVLQPDPDAPPGANPDLRRLAPTARLVSSIEGRNETVRFWAGSDGTTLCIYATPDQHYCLDQTSVDTAAVLQPASSPKPGFLPEGTVWNRFLVVIAREGYDTVTVGETSEPILHGFAVFSRGMPTGDEVVVSGPAGTVRYPLPPS